MVEGVLRFRFRAILSEEEGFKVLVGFVGGLEEESWGALAYTMTGTTAQARTGEVLV